MASNHRSEESIVDNVLTFNRGRVPLLISMPHAGLKLTPAVRDGLVDEALSLPDTDWHIPRLYDFAAELGASTLAAEYSRFVIDLNRPADDTPLYAGATTGLYPSILFDGVPLFKAGQAPGGEERAMYLEQIWKPYHQKLEQELARLREEFGYALLFDAHSIRGHVPHLFDGRLPDFNLGTFNGASCDTQLANRLDRVCAAASQYSHVLNGRFKGGHITRHYGNPANHIHAVQLELAQSTYMDEFAPFHYRPDLAEPTRVVLRELLETFIAWGQERFER
jgi:formiminoglutamase